MVRAVAGDQGLVEPFVEALYQAGCSVQVGLLVGKFGAESPRDLVFSLVPTPQNDGEDPATVASSSGDGGGAGRKGGKGKPAVDSSSLQIDVEWVAEHARQVSRMLMGGMQIVGLYVFATEGAFKNSQLMLWQALQAVAAAVSSELQGSRITDMLLLHISLSPRRLSCRSCSLGSSFSSTLLKPCDWKLQKLAPNLRSFTASYHFNIRTPVTRDSQQAGKSLKDSILSGIALEAARLEGAKALLDGSLVDSETELHLEIKRDEPHLVELLLPFHRALGNADSGNGRNIDGTLSLSGSVSARAVAHTKEPLWRAVSYLKDDIISSLRARLELLCDEAEQTKNDGQMAKGDVTAKETVAGNNSSTQYPLEQLLTTRDSPPVLERSSCALPPRVFIPWQDGYVVSDYLLPNETLEDVRSRCQELLGINLLQTSHILEPEFVASITSIPVQEEKGHKSPPSSTATGTTIGSKQPIWRFNMIFLASVLCLFFSVVLPYLWAR